MLAGIIPLVLFRGMAGKSAWEEAGNMDRASLLPNGTEFSKDLILWQNMEECHHCSWVRARDKKGDVLPQLAPNTSYLAWIDTRWRMRFRFAANTSTNTDYQGLTPIKICNYYKFKIF